jgi:hypothetical protein
MTERALEGIYTGPPVDIPPRKEDCNCACGIKDELGRYPIGWCGPDCERRPQ